MRIGHVQCVGDLRRATRLTVLWWDESLQDERLETIHQDFPDWETIVQWAIHYNPNRIPMQVEAIQ